MTINQIQHLLAYLGFDPGPCDGLEGPRTRAAVRGFQARVGIPGDGEAGQATQKALVQAVVLGLPEKEAQEGGGFWAEIKHFSRTEFRCTCNGRSCNGFPAEPAERLIRNAEAARVHFGAVADVSSGVRCSLRNAELPGSAANSLHLQGKAMDFRIRGVNARTLLAYVKTLPEVDEAYAIDDSFVHMGVLKDDHP